jgi:hypothetical protein
MRLPLLILPLTPFALVVGALGVLAARWSGRQAQPTEFWSGIAWVVSGALLGSLVWRLGAPLFGWKLGGLGGGLYVLVALPV